MERLIVSLEARTKAFENALQKSDRETQKHLGSIQRQFDRANKKLSLKPPSFMGIGRSALGGLGAGLAAGFTVQQAQQLLDAATRINNALKLAGLSGDELKRVYEGLKAAALENGTPLEALANLYSKVARSQKELGVSGREIESFTKNIAVALRVAGKSASESSGAILQLTQALGGGVVRAEEFNSVLEGAPTIIQAVANGLDEAGGSVAKLRTLVNDGAVSSTAFFKAFQAGSVTIAAQAKETQTTIAQAYTNVGTALVDLASQFDQSTGASDAFAASLNGVAAAIQGAGNFLNDLIEINKRYKQSLAAIDAGAMVGGLAGSTAPATSTTPKTGRLPFASQADIQQRIDDAFAPAKISLKDYPVDAATTKPAKGSLAESISRQAAVAVDAAEQLLGAHESVDAGRINAFLKRGGVDIKASQTAWCAAFVNSALAQMGIKGNGSLTATDFAKWGASVNASDVMRGDVLVESRGQAIGATGGHVGLATGAQRVVGGKQQIEMISGNSGDSVRRTWENAGNLLIRRATEGIKIPAEQLKAGLDSDGQDLTGWWDGVAQSTDGATQATAALTQQYDALGGIATTALNGIATALADGKIEGEELLSILIQIVQQLLTMPGGLFGGGSGGGGGGLLGSLFGGLFGGGGGGFGLNYFPPAPAPFIGGLFAKGGIASRGMRRYAGGGVARKASIFGEAGPEAAVPLPDGRTIPVTLSAPRIPGGNNGSTRQHSTYNVNVTGASGDAHIVSLVKQGVAMGISANNRQRDAAFPAKIKKAQRDVF